MWRDVSQAVNTACSRCCYVQVSMRTINTINWSLFSCFVPQLHIRNTRSARCWLTSLSSATFTDLSSRDASLHDVEKPTNIWIQWETIGSRSQVKHSCRCWWRTAGNIWTYGGTMQIHHTHLPLEKLWTLFSSQEISTSERNQSDYNRTNNFNPQYVKKKEKKQMTSTFKIIEPATCRAWQPAKG